MGQQQPGALFPRYGCCLPSQNPDLFQVNHPRAFPLQRQKSNLSATFNFSEVSRGHASPTASSYLININTATEEELMTLPGVNRQTAANVVAYRRQIGSFRRVEDLAPVSGIGATRLENLRYEICVSEKAHAPNDSYSNGTVELNGGSINGSCRSHHRSGSRSKVNVNSASIFQLMKIKFVTQAIAENIVTYRETKGPFLNLDELNKVKGMKPALLSSIRPHLVLWDRGISSHPGKNSENGEAVRLKTSYIDDECPITSPLKLGSVRRKRPRATPRSNSVLRFATWSLDRCGLDKAGNPGVQDVVAMTILENGIDLLAIQDVTCGQVLQKLCDALNVPELYNVKAWPHPKGRWESAAAPVGKPENDEEPFAVGFMINVDSCLKICGVNSRLVMTSTDKETNQSALCYVVDFTINGCKINFANFSFTSRAVKNPEFKSWKDLIRTLRHSKSGTHLVISGEFASTGNFQDEVTKVFEDAGFRSAIGNDRSTNISDDRLNGSKCSENIWLSPETYPLFDGRSVIVREGLSSPWIPNGWQWGGLVSKHCPVLVDLSFDQKPIEEST